MEELLAGISRISFWSNVANLHGFLAMTSLALFGASFVLYFQIAKIPSLVKWFKGVLMALFINIALLDIFGLYVYIAYRASGGPRSLLLSSKETSWFHEILFEHKEFLAFAPLILLFVAAFIAVRVGSDITKNENVWIRRTVLALLLLSFIFVFAVAAEAVLVTKEAPVK